MFIHARLASILLPVIVVWVVLLLIFRLRARHEGDPVIRAWREFKFSTISTGVMLLVLWFSLPFTPVLSTFGYPAGLEAVSQPQLLLNTLQDYNRALVRTIDVVYWLLFIFVWWFLFTLYSFSKALTLAARQRNSPTEAQ
jgi:hypothetical protein